MNSQTNKSEEKSDKIVSLEFNYSNVKSKSKTFGEIELKYISDGDLTFLAELLDKVKDDKEFVIQVLYHQLTTPKVSFTEFNKIPNEELIEIARDFVGHEQHTFQYFRETTDTEFFTNFREAIKTYHQKQVERLQTALGPMTESSIRALENFNKQYASSIRPLGPAIENINKQYASSIRQLKSAIEQYQLTARIVSEYLASSRNFLQNWVEQNRNIFDTYGRFWQTFQKEYQIPEQEANQILGKYKWFITTSLPQTLILEAVKIGGRTGNQRKIINRLFVDCYSSNNFEHLESLVDGWETNEIFKPRMKILRDCVFVMKNAKGKYNPSNIVLPTLIAQIDGIRIEFMNRNGLSFWTKVEKWKGLFNGLTLNQKLYESANDIFLNILFQESQPGKPLETPFTFNRHKIIHGEYLKYGRIDNTIRAFLILDFLATLSNKGSKS